MAPNHADASLADLCRQWLDLLEARTRHHCIGAPASLAETDRLVEISEALIVHAESMQLDATPLYDLVAWPSNAPWQEVIQLVKRLETASRLTVSKAGKTARDEEDQRKKRPRLTKQQTLLKTLAAITYKAKNPTATEDECAREVGISRTTLRGQLHWIEWVPKIEAAAATGKLPHIQHAIDNRTGEVTGIVSGCNR